MKRILITGSSSYIGVSFANYLTKWSESYCVDTMDLIDGLWRDKSFAGYDVVFHVAGIAHIKETKENAHLYYEVNCDLPIEVAEKAKIDGVKQFIFMSSMSVYGMDTGVITKETVPQPKSNYGKSKLEAEEGLKEYISEMFLIAILRPPMVYGKGCQGNFQTVVHFVKKSPVFPKIKNQRSMIYIDNLCSFVKLAVDKNLNGIFYPQNPEYICTSDMAKAIAAIIGRKVYFSRFAGLAVKIGIKFTPICRKAFGTLIYRDTEEFSYSYCTTDTASTIRKSI